MNVFKTNADYDDLKFRIDVAMGRKAADTLFVNGKVVSTFTEEVLDTNVAVARGKVVALGHTGNAKTVVDLGGSYLCPALIDAHIHIESAMLTPERFAQAVVPHGTGAIISDPHEITNVFGIDGFEFMVLASSNLPLACFFGIPSCVPATHMETSGGTLSDTDIEKIVERFPNITLLSEIMNYPSVCQATPETLTKIIAAQKLGLMIDGHAPTVQGRQLNAYLNAQIVSDHECSTITEAREKLQKGMWILIREGTAARNLKALFPLLSHKTTHRICLVSDDLHPDDILRHGHMDRIWRKLIELGMNPIRALRLMTLNPATLYCLNGFGGIGVGHYAHFFTTQRLSDPVVESVYFAGRLVARRGQYVGSIQPAITPRVQQSVRLPTNLFEMLLRYPTAGPVHVIGLQEGQLLTQKRFGDAQNVKIGDLCYAAVIERHGKNGNVGLGFVEGLGLKSGALASTVAHDHHNLVLVGKTPDDMNRAAIALAKMGGGFCVVNNGNLMSSASLPVGGIMSPVSAETLTKDLSHLNDAARTLGVTFKEPFMALSFLALPVIPHLKLTDQGLVDVERFEIIPLGAKLGQ